MFKFSALPKRWISVTAPVQALVCANPVLWIRCGSISRWTIPSTFWVVKRSISMIFFERDLEDTDSESVVEDWLEEITQEEPGDRYSVVLHNDAINGVDVVTRVVHAVFGYGMRESAWLMLKAHFTGRSALWVGASAKVEQKRNQTTAHDPDPNMLHKGARPLTVSVERNE